MEKAIRGLEQKITPSATGWSQFSIAPVGCQLEWVHGATPLIQNRPAYVYLYKRVKGSDNRQAWGGLTHLGRRTK